MKTTISRRGIIKFTVGEKIYLGSYSTSAVLILRHFFILDNGLKTGAIEETIIKKTQN